MTTPAENHREVAAAFTKTVEGVASADWEQPSPAEGWVARDVVRHLVEWLPPFLEGSTGIVLPPGPSVDDDPLGAWRNQTDAVQALLEDPAQADQVHDLPQLGSMSVAQAIDMIYVGDVFVHRWDLARATGQDDTLDPARCEAMYQGMQPLDEMIRQDGMFGPKIEVAADADPQTRLLGFTGRNPWPSN